MASASAVGLPSFHDFKPETLRGEPGCFRLGLARDGRWWLLDPQDRPFFSQGVTAINRAGTAGGRQARRGPYADTIDRRFGADDPQPFVDDVLRRLRAWHFNTLGPWTGDEFYDRGLPYTEILDFRRMSEHAFRLGPALLPDVFDPRWETDCDRWAAELCGPRRESRGLIGYFTDHALGWAQAGDATPARPTLLQLCLSLEPAYAAYHAAWEFVLAPHAGDFAALCRAWGVDWVNKEALRQLTQDEVPLATRGYLDDQARFSREFARRYVRVTSEAIRRHDPHHLILGCRFADPLPGPDILQAFVSPWVDAVSLTCEQADPVGRVERLHAATGQPVWVAEFSWSGEAFQEGEWAGEPPGLSGLERMHRRGRAALEAVAAHGAVVGYAWNRWVQGDPGDVPPFASGLVYTNDQTAHEHVEPLAALNRRLAGLHAGAA